MPIYVSIRKQVPVGRVFNNNKPTDYNIVSSVYINHSEYNIVSSAYINHSGDMRAGEKHEGLRGSGWIFRVPVMLEWHRRGTLLLLPWWRGNDNRDNTYHHDQSPNRDNIDQVNQCPNRDNIDHSNQCPNRDNIDHYDQHPSGRTMQIMVCTPHNKLGQEMQMEKLCWMFSVFCKTAPGKWHVRCVMEPCRIIFCTAEHELNMS
jgi:hypothetical protein